MTQINTSRSIIRKTKRELRFALRHTTKLIERGLKLVLLPTRILKRKGNTEENYATRLLNKSLTSWGMNALFVVRKISTSFRLTTLTVGVANTLKALATLFLATTGLFYNQLKMMRVSIGLSVPTAISGRELRRSFASPYGISNLNAESFFNQLLK